MLWYEEIGHVHLRHPLVLLSLDISWFAGGYPCWRQLWFCLLLRLNEHFIFAFANCLELIPVLQLFLDTFGQFPSPMVFLRKVFGCTQTSNADPSICTPGGLLVSLRVLGSSVLTSFYWDLSLWLLGLFFPPLFSRLSWSWSVAGEDHLCPRSAELFRMARVPSVLVQCLMEGRLHPWELQTNALPSALQEAVFRFGSRSREGK